MAAPVTGAVGIRGGGGVEIALQPPLGFILKQTGAFRHQLEDLVPLWELFKPIMSSVEEEQFASHGHGAWPPLAESTLRQKIGPDIMVETGDLKSSLVDPGRAAKTGPMHMEWGTDVSYAHWHQTGGTIAGRPPERRLIDIRPEDRRRFEVAMVTWINAVAAATMGRIAA